MDCSLEYAKMEMEYEPRKSFWRGRLCSKQTGIIVGTVCMIIVMIMTSVICSNQERKFSVLERWMNNHTSDLTAVKSDIQTTEVHEKKLSNIETLMTNLDSSLSSLASKQEENQQKLEHQQDLMDNLTFALSALSSKLTADSLASSQVSLRTQRNMGEMSRSLTNLKSSVEELRSLVQFMSYKLSLTNLLTPGCTEPNWVPFSNSCYLFSSNLMNWTQAKNYCEKSGALLLKLEDGSEKEWEFVTNLATPFPYWIGLTDQTTGQWRWADDAPCTMDKVQWGPGQPDEWQGHQLGGGEDCAHITIYGNVNDNHCDVKMRFICKGSKDS